MGHLTLAANGAHRNVLLDDLSKGELAVQANNHVIADGKDALVLDPGGHKVFARALAETASALGGARVTRIFLSHQDPDIVAALNGWLMSTDAVAYASRLWLRFIPHFGMDRFVADRLLPIADEGMVMTLGQSELLVLPAHFLHSAGNFQIYDPTAKILYSGDLGASLGTSYREVPDFDSHLPSMLGFHQRYMTSNAALRRWAAMVRQLDIEILAPQHGAFFRGKELVNRFIDWADDLACGVDLLPAAYAIPGRSAAS